MWQESKTKKDRTKSQSQDFMRSLTHQWCHLVWAWNESDLLLCISPKDTFYLFPGLNVNTFQHVKFEQEMVLTLNSINLMNPESQVEIFSPPHRLRVLWKHCHLVRVIDKSLSIRATHCFNMFSLAECLVTSAVMSPV